MQEIRKNFKFQSDTIARLDDMKNESGKNHTQLIEEAIKYVHGEYIRAKKGMDHDELALCMVLGKIVEKSAYSNSKTPYKVATLDSMLVR
jgi:hypothetical protein